MSSFILKIIAILAMTADHIGATFFPLGATYFPFNVILRTIGRLTMPIMCFFIGEGYKKTRDRKKYAFRLLVFALISEIPFRMLFQSNFNVMFTLFIGFCGLWISDILKEKLNTDRFRILVYIGALLTAFLLQSDWNYIGVLFIIAFYHCGESPVKKIIYPLSVYIFVLLKSFFEAEFITGLNSFYINFIQFSGCLSIPILLTYNGKRGPSLKYLFYIYYPLHMIILWGIKALELI